MGSPLSRRQVLRGGLATAAASALWPRLSRTALAAPSVTSHVVLIFLRGGYNALLPSADSFLGSGSFGVTASNDLDVGGGLLVDRGTYGTLGEPALSHVAAIGMNHGISSHEGGR